MVGHFLANDQLTKVSDDWRDEGEIGVGPDEVA